MANFFSFFQVDLLFQSKICVFKCLELVLKEIFFSVFVLNFIYILRLR